MSNETDLQGVDKLTNLQEAIDEIRKEQGAIANIAGLARHLEVNFECTLRVLYSRGYVQAKISSHEKEELADLLMGFVRARQEELQPTIDKMNILSELV